MNCWITFLWREPMHRNSYRFSISSFPFIFSFLNISYLANKIASLKMWFTWKIDAANLCLILTPSHRPLILWSLIFMSMRNCRSKERLCENGNWFILCVYPAVIRTIPFMYFICMDSLFSKNSNAYSGPLLEHPIPLTSLYALYCKPNIFMYCAINLHNFF